MGLSTWTLTSWESLGWQVVGRIPRPAAQSRALAVLPCIPQVALWDNGIIFRKHCMKSSRSMEMTLVLTRWFLISEA